MNTATVTTKLPTLGELAPDVYRGIDMDNFFNVAYASPSRIAEGLTPQALAEEGLIYSARQVSVWNEAHNENARRTASAVEEDLRTVDHVTELTALREQIAVLSEQVGTQRSELDRLRNEQIRGDDPRLADFWERANEVATAGDQCGVYDQMAQELGGPGRVRNYSLTLDIDRLRVTVQASGSDVDDAYENIDPDEVDEAVASYVQSNNVDFSLYTYEQID